jgi:prolyl-tRNA synthetase
MPSCKNREARAGEKFADADLIGIPLRIVVSDKTIEKGEFEVKERKAGSEAKMLKEKDLWDLFKK